MSGEEVAFGLDLEGDMAVVAKKMAAEMSRLEAQIKAVGKATTKTERSFAQLKWTGADAENMRRHVSYIERSRKAYKDLAPASSAAARGLRSFGVSGSWIRKFSTDTAKAEIALRRLYKVKGGDKEGAAAVVGSLARRGVGKYGGAVASKAGGLAWGASKLVGGATLAAGAAGLAGAGLLGYNMLQASVDAEQLRFALDRITSGNGQWWWDKSAEYAKKFGLQVDSVASSLMGMKASGLDDNTTLEMFQRFADMKSQGVTSNQIDMGLLGFKQMMSNGVVQMEDLKQVTENLMLDRGLVMQTLATQMGKSTLEVEKLQGSGKLKSTDMAKAISTAIGIQTKSPTAGAAGAASGDATVGGAWDKLKSSVSVLMANSLSSDQLAPLRQSISNFTEWLNGPGGSKLKTSFGDIMSKLIDYAPMVIDKVIWLFSEALPAAMTSFGNAFESSGGSAAMDQLLGVAGSLGGETGASTIQWAQKFGEMLGNLTGSVVELVNAAKPMFEMAQLFNLPLMLAAKGVGAITGWMAPSNDNGGADSATSNDGGSLYGVGQNMAQGMAGGLYSGAPGVAAAGAYLAKTAEDAARAQSETHSPSRAWERLANDETDGYIGGHRKAIPQIQSTAAGITAASLSAASNSDNGSSGGGSSQVTVNINIDRGEGEGRSDRDLMELAADIFERRMARVFGRLSYAGVG